MLSRDILKVGFAWFSDNLNVSFFFLFIRPLSPFVCFSFFIAFSPFFCLVFLLPLLFSSPSFFPLFFVSDFRLLWVSSLAYPNLIEIKRLGGGCCCCETRLKSGYTETLYVFCLGTLSHLDTTKNTVFGSRCNQCQSARSHRPLYMPIK
jgi:hypothetical protein